MSYRQHEPMTVRRVGTEHGSHVEPPLEQSWSNLDKLRWHAALVEHETGITVRVVTGALSAKPLGRWRVVPDSYSFRVGHGQIGSFDYREAWTYLNGVADGAKAREGA